MLKIRALFCQHFLLLYVRVDFLLSRGKHWHCDVCMCEESLQKFKKRCGFLLVVQFLVPIERIVIGKIEIVLKLEMLAH